MLSPYLKRIAIDVFLFVALGLGVFYIYKIFLDFLISLFHFDMGGNLSTVNVSSLAYCIQRLIWFFLPLVMLTVINRFSKLKLLKVLYFTMGICYLLGNSWIIIYIVEKQPLVNLFYGSIPRWFLNNEQLVWVENIYTGLRIFQRTDAFVFNYIIWDSYDLFAVLFSTVQGVLYIQLALILDTSRGKVLRKMILILILSVLFPWVYNVVVQKNWLMTKDWLNWNILLVFESVFILIALNIAATSRNFWHDVLW